VKLIQAKLKETRIDCLQVRNDSIELFDLPKSLRPMVMLEILVNVLLVVRFKPVEKKDKFLMALIIALKVLLTRKYESIRI
jgi:hypothetical protein